MGEQQVASRPPVVKTLMWVAGDDITRDKESWHASDGFGGYYTVIEGWWSHGSFKEPRVEDNDDLAKAAAQADYERRIRSALA